MFGRYVFTDVALEPVFSIATDKLVPGQPARIEKLRLVIDREERDLAAVAGYPNTHHGPRMR